MSAFLTQSKSVRELVTLLIPLAHEYSYCMGVRLGGTLVITFILARSDSEASVFTKSENMVRYNSALTSYTL